MSRIKRYNDPGYVWHLTHRCYKKEFRLRFARDRRRWTEWLFEAKKRYGLQILNYMVTSNHIHLLVSGSGQENIISKSIQLIADRTGQEYNLRKNRKDPFWEDQYHATAIQTDHHFVQCMIYMDLNMVRAGVVGHPSQWEYSGFNEIQNPKVRYRLIDYDRLLALLNIDTIDKLKTAYCQWIEDALKNENKVREAKWSQNIAVGDEAFIEKIKKELGPKARYRKAMGNSTEFQLKEEQIPYSVDDDIEKIGLGAENLYFWNDVG
jgi:putative transposase